MVQYRLIRNYRELPTATFAAKLGDSYTARTVIVTLHFADGTFVINHDSSGGWRSYPQFLNNQNIMNPRPATRSLVGTVTGWIHLCAAMQSALLALGALERVPEQKAWLVVGVNRPYYPINWA